MTDDERRDEAATPSTDSDAASEDDVDSGIDPLKRWANPETRWGDPERDLPKIPRVRIPGEDAEQSFGDELRDDDIDLTGNADPEQSRLFWASVIFANVGLAGLALGVMLIFFRGQLWVGGGLILLGILALSRVYAIYQEFTATDWSGDDDADDDDSTDPTDAGPPDTDPDPNDAGPTDTDSDPTDAAPPDDERNR